MSKIETFLDSIDPMHFGSLAGDFFDRKTFLQVDALKKLVHHYRAYPLNLESADREAAQILEALEKDTNDQRRTKDGSSLS